MVKHIKHPPAWTDTSWSTECDAEGTVKITINEVIEYLSSQEAEEFPLEALSESVGGPGGVPDWAYDRERVEAANLEYPIIVVVSGGHCRYVLDGNHRYQKAVNHGAESILVKNIDLDKPETPKVFKQAFEAPY